MPQPLLMLSAFAGALVVTFALTPLVGAYARSVGLVDYPGGRKVHDRPVPRVGGVAVFFGLLVGALSYSLAFGTERLTTLLVSEGHLSLLVPCAIIFIMGLIDDLRGLTPLVKVVVQAGAAMMCIQAGFIIDELWTPFGFSVPLGLLAYPVTLIWFIGVTNAFNLIDGLDGLLTSVGLASLLGCAGVAVMVDQTGTAYFPLTLAGALAGFLYWNWHRARVFMGDCGSLLVGFVVAALALKVSRYYHRPTPGVALHVMLALCAVPAAETFLSLIRRHISGQPYFAGDASHIHHVLIVNKKLTIRRAVTILALVQVLFSAVAIASRMRLGWTSLIPATILGTTGLIGVRWLGYVEFKVIGRRLWQLATNRSRREIADAVKLARAGEIIRRVDTPAALAAALERAVDVGGFWFLAIEFTDAGREMIHDERPPMRADCKEAQEYAACIGERHVWLFSASSGASDGTSGDADANGSDETGASCGDDAGSIRYTVPFPADGTPLATVVCERRFDSRGRAPTAFDIKAYVVAAIEDAVAQIAARDSKLLQIDGET